VSQQFDELIRASLRDLAGKAQPVDLTAQALERAQRGRRTSLALAAAGGAALVVFAVPVAAAVSDGWQGAAGDKPRPACKSKPAPSGSFTKPVPSTTFTKPVPSTTFTKPVPSSTVKKPLPSYTFTEPVPSGKTMDPEPTKATPSFSPKPRPSLSPKPQPSFSPKPKPSSGC